MCFPEVVPEDQWLIARKALLVREKEFTRLRDALSAERRRLPVVRVVKDYVFEGPTGQVGLAGMFGGARQLIVQHFMFDPGWDAGCPSCTSTADELSAGLLAHLRARDTAFAVVSRAPLPKIEAYKTARGWTFPWYSSFGDFNYDFHVTLDSSVTPVMWNYRTIEELKQAGMGGLGEGSSEQPGYSMFLRDGEAVFHTYSTYARGTEMAVGTYHFIDHTALGRQED
jgi:predicted dithiol-disulfide oxidoreductase (DUF899 family)